MASIAPKYKISKRRGRNRRAHWKLTAPTLTACPRCRAMKLTHRVCTVCGYYNGEKIIEIDEKKAGKA